jgi:two-component system phosphate regulon sensor histidine kinase PhoR
MKRKGLLWQLYPSYLLLTIIAMLVIVWHTTHSLRRFYYKQVSENITSRAYLIQEQVSTNLISHNFEEIDSFCKETGPLSATRITVILPGGRVIGDSDEQVADMQNHADRPEFREALTGNVGSSTRFSNTLGMNMMYLAIPIYSEDQIMAVLRTSVPVSEIDDELMEMYHKILWAVLVVAVLAAVISLVLSGRIAQPIAAIEEAARRYASGDLALRLAVSKPAELSDLAKAMNKMARQLDERIKTISSQSAEADAILSSMIEGVIAIDSEGQIVRMNRAAADLLGVNTKQAEQRSIEETLYNHADIIQFAQKALQSSAPIETEVVLAGEDRKHLKLHAARLTNTDGNYAGAVVVMTNMTRIRQLQKVRQDFVANVSHELKTPITSIKGFVETLQEGALANPEQAKRFLEIIARHADRLNAIIDDLLTLSRLEEDTERRALSFEITPLKPILTEAIELSEMKAEEKRIQISLDCDENIQARVNPALLEQAVTNLINNAIKYSEKSSTIKISATQTDSEIHISVNDQGCGIEKKYHERIFQRFYVVDKSRSRKLGGTGLGLAIVKHIAQVHDGSITIESQLGKGSKFTIHLPLGNPDA